MKTTLSITLIVAGALLILTPMIIECMGHARTDGDAVTISIVGKKPWGGTAAMSIGTVIIGITALLSVKRQKYEEPVYVHKDHTIGENEPSIRGELQFAGQTPNLPADSLETHPSDTDESQAMDEHR